MALPAPRARRRPRRTLWVWIALLAGFVAVCQWPSVAVQLRLRQMAARGTPVRVDGKPVQQPPNADNAAWLYLEAERVIDAGMPLRFETADLDDPAAVKAMAARAAPALPLVREAAGKPDCVFPRVPEPMPILWEKWRRPDVGSIAPALAASAVAAANAGDGELARECLLLGFGLWRADWQDTALHLSGDHRVLFRAADKVRRSGAMTTPDARRLSAVLQTMNAAEMDSYDVAAGYANGVEMYRWIKTHPREAVGTFFLGTPPGADHREAWEDLKAGFARVGLIAYFASPLTDLNLLRYFDAVDRAGPLWRPPWRRSRETLQRLAPRGTSALAPALDPGLPLWGMQLLVQERDCDIAQRALLQAALALHEYKAEHGSFPAALSEVRIEGLPIPDDVFSGKPFIYRRKGDGFVLYSIGPNLRNDGGRWEEGGPDDDITWPPSLELEWWDGYE